ncbi:MAG: EscF/YscF/HrpA family type III secretion system needle major subunit [Proteobacteria bacterium]|jgi:hypothetical protein|nr:EscF/YscF/HrpA family type III secretion system needle major subunit [Pseudomonadota bacterium]
MALVSQTSMFNLDTVTSQMGSAVQSQEGQMAVTLNSLQNNPNPSQQDLIIFQANMQLWSNMISMESSITKVYGDTMKQVVNNMGS